MSTQRKRCPKRERIPTGGKCIFLLVNIIVSGYLSVNSGILLSCLRFCYRISLFLDIRGKRSNIPLMKNGISDLLPLMSRFIIQKREEDGAISLRDVRAEPMVSVTPHVSTSKPIRPKNKLLRSFVTKLPVTITGKVLVGWSMTI